MKQRYRYFSLLGDWCICLTASIRFTVNFCHVLGNQLHISGPSRSAVQGMRDLEPAENWNLGFESRSKYGRVTAFV